MANEIIRKIYIDPAEKHDLGGYAENILMDIPEENQDVSEIKNVKEAIEDVVTTVDEEKANNSIYNDNFISRKAFIAGQDSQEQIAHVTEDDEETTEDDNQDHIGHGSIEYLLVTLPVANKGAKGKYSQAFGHEVSAAGDYSHAEGDGSTAHGVASHAENNGTAASNYSHAEGNGFAQGDYAHAEGSSSVYTSAYAHGEGMNTTIRNGSEAAHAEGKETKASNEAAHAEGKGTIASGIASHAEGGRNETTLDEGDEVLGAEGNYSHSEGYNTYARGIASHTEGDYTKVGVNGRGGHAEGYLTQVIAQCGHAEGYNTQAGYVVPSGGGSSVITGEYAHAEGNSTVAGGVSSHAEGKASHAYGEASHVEGANNFANGDYSHAEGSDNTVHGIHGHVGGNNCEAEGDCVFYHGINGKVFGDFSMALGPDMDINSQRTYAIGRGIKTPSNGQQEVTYIGNFPRAVINSEDRIIFGIGTSDSNRKNGFQISNTGNAYMDHGGLKTEFITLYKEHDDPNSDAQTLNYNHWTLGSTQADCIGTSGSLWVQGTTYSHYATLAGSDYAEYFYDWEDNDITEKIGYFVTCKNKKLYKASSSDNVIGITSNTYGILGTKEDANENWTPVGIMGQIPVKDDGTCEEGKYCKCADGGIATLATERSFDTWLVLERIDSNTVLVLFK